MSLTSTAIIHIALEIWGVLFCIIAAISVGLEGNRRSRSDWMIVAMELTVAALLTMDAVAWGFRGYPGTFGSVMVRGSNMAVYLLSYATLIEFTTYQISVIGDNTDFPIRVWGSSIYCIAIVGMVIVIVSQFTDFLYYFDAANCYHRTENFYVSQLIAVVGMILAAYMMCYHREKYSSDMFISLLSYMALPLLAAIMQLFVYGVALLNIAIALSMLLIYASWQIDRSRENERMARRLLEQEKRLNKQQQDIMMSQIQPHFIFNSLTAIAQLCEKQPRVARDATISFAEFLRANIDTLKNPEPIPFSRELENIENYLMLEKIRFGDQLDIRYDIQEDTFQVPSLSIQPLVENAIKHGIRQSGMVEIRTRELEDAYEVVIQDNGIGYDGTTVPDDGRNHIGVENIRSRLKDLVQATLTFEIPKEGGTIARVYIPKHGNTNSDSSR